MAIIIPSRHTYNLENDKIIDNKIDGVSYSQIAIEDKKSDLWTAVSISASATETTSISYGDYVEVSSTIRKRVKVEKTTQQRKITMSGYTPPIDINWDKAYWEFRQNLTDNLAGTDSLNELVIPNNISSPPAVPSFNIGNEALISYAKQLWKYGFDANIAEGTSPTAFIYCYSHIILSIVTETLSSGNWKQTETKKVYDTSATLYSGNTNSPVLRFYIDNSYDVKSTITVGNSKSAYSLPSNDLFTNTATVSNQKLGDYVANQIIAEYANGKETATLLCSISNYYDENGNQVKFDNGEDMTFNIYDEVVPMVYDSSGIDVPMSQTEYGKAKGFTVLGVEIFYDGAVWQRLTLQNSGKYIGSETILRPPLISITNEILQIQDNSGKAESFNIFANGMFVTNITATSVALNTIALDYGSYSIYVVAKASGFEDSLPSNSVDWQKMRKYDTPIISLTNTIINITDVGGLAESFDILVNDVVVTTTTNITYDLSNLSLDEGSYSISVIARASGYKDSEKSNTVTYVVLPKAQLATPSISYSNRTLTITDSSLKAQRATIFINNIEISTVDFNNGTAQLDVTNYVIIYGEYSIYTTSKANDYMDSEISNTVQVVTKATDGLKYIGLFSDWFVNGLGTATDTDIVIPSVYQNGPVTKIVDGAFKGNAIWLTNITSVSIPKSVIEIGSTAFAYTEITDIYVQWSKGKVSGAPWGATNATIHYDCGVK